MGYTIGDGMVAVALAAGVIGYLYLKHWSRLRRIEIIHEERLAAMEKGIPLPEFPLERVPGREPDPAVLPILGTVLLTLSVGTMIVLYLVPGLSPGGFWISPLPFAFLGVGLIAVHFVKGEPGR